MPNSGFFHGFFSRYFGASGKCLGASNPAITRQLREVKVVEIPIILHRVGWHHPFGGWEWDF